MKRYKKHTHRTMMNAILAAEVLDSTEHKIKQLKLCSIEANEMLDVLRSRAEEMRDKGLPVASVSLKANMVRELVEQASDALVNLQYQHKCVNNLLARGAF